VESGLTRRELLRATIVLSPIAVVGCASMPRRGGSLLRADEPVARAVAYYPSTLSVPADNPLATTHDPGQRCADCLRQRGPAGNGALNCPTFPGRLVSENGWCSLWTAR